MNPLTIDDLRVLMRSCAGVDESIDPEADIDDVNFIDLGYDSLAILEMANQVQRRYGLLIPDDAVHEMLTPRQALVYLNRCVETARAGG